MINVKTATIVVLFAICHPAHAIPSTAITKLSAGEDKQFQEWYKGLVKRDAEIDEAIDQKSDEALKGLLKNGWECSEGGYRKALAFAIMSDRFELAKFLLSGAWFDLNQEKALATSQGKTSMLRLIQEREKKMGFVFQVAVRKLLS